MRCALNVLRLRWRLSFAAILFSFVLSPALAQFSEPVSKTSRTGRQYSEIVVTIEATYESCFFASCSTKVVPARGLLWIPDGGTRPYKLVVFSHGAQGPRRSHPTGIEPDAFGLAGDLFRRGYAVLYALRKGRAVNQLPEPEVSPDDFETNMCRDDMRPGVKSATSDLKAYLRVLGQRSDVDSQSILLIGHSRGGVTSLSVAAEDYPGVVGVINISGGWITPYAVWGAPGDFCQPSFNPKVFEELGNTLRKPVLSLYGNKDPLFDVEHTKKNLSFLGKHAPSDYFIADGANHSANVGPADRAAWNEKLEKYLRSIGH